MLTVSEIIDDIDRMAAIDRSNMFSHLRDFPDHLRGSLDCKPALEVESEKVFICGVGGSAIGGEILAELASHVSSKIVSVVRGVDLPRWVDGGSLAVIVSYTGNTLETLQLFRHAEERGCAIVAVTSGGDLMKLCRERAYPVIAVPGGMQPRAALGYLLGSTAAVMESAGVGPLAAGISRSIDELATFRDSLSAEVPLERNQAKRLAGRLRDTVPVILAAKPLRPAAMRWQTQINENAKMLASCGDIPEMNHNQIIGWMEGDNSGQCRPVVIESASCGQLMDRLVKTTVAMLQQGGLGPEVIPVPGENPISAMLHAIVLGDHVSYYLAMLREVDPTPVASILAFKKRMASSSS